MTRNKSLHRAFVPFLMCGDGDTVAHARTAINAGADALELGVPFSDPVADGPVIQAASLRAAGTTVDDCLDIVRRIRAEFPDTPIGMLIYGNIMFARDTLYDDFAEAGADSILIPDIPVRESAIILERAKNIDPIFIAPANADEKTLANIARVARGYVYAVSRDGVTGTDKKPTARVPHFDIPVLVGFGISTPDDVRTALEAGADGVICGSAVIEAIQRGELAEFVSSMKAQTYPQ